MSRRSFLELSGSAALFADPRRSLVEMAIEKDEKT